MKYFLFFFCLVVFSFACRNKKRDIILQNNQIITDQIEFYKLNDSLFTLFEQETTEEKYLALYDSLNGFLKSAIAKYDTIQPADDKGELVMAMQNFLRSYQQLAYNEYQELLHIISKPRYLFESSDLPAVDSLYSIIALRQNEIDSLFSAKHEAYSIKYDIHFSE